MPSMVSKMSPSKCVIQFIILCSHIVSRILTAVSLSNRRGSEPTNKIKMATIRLITVKNLSKHLINRPQICNASSKFNTTAIGGLSHVDKVVTTSDNSTFVAWHPTTEFPYEYSKPLPPPAIPTSTLLKDEAMRTAMQAFGNKHPEIARKELEKLTFTSKHTWKPRQRDRKAKKTKPDREYL